MTKNVIVCIAGTQLNDQNPSDEPIELVTRGTYYKKNNKHYVLYDEMVEGVSGVTKNTIKFDENMVMLTRTGALNTTMLFENNKRNITDYRTPFGNVVIGLNTKSIDIKEDKDEIQLMVDYSIDANFEYLSDCSISLKIQAAGK